MEKHKSRTTSIFHFLLVSISYLLCTCSARTVLSVPSTSTSGSFFFNAAPVHQASSKPDFPKTSGPQLIRQPPRRRPCDMNLKFTELQSRVGTRYTDQVDVFSPAVDSASEHGGAEAHSSGLDAPGATQRPGVEFNFMYRLFEGHQVPTESADLGTMQGKCLTTEVDESGEPKTFWCSATATLEGRGTLSLSGPFEAASATGTMAVHGGTGEFVAATGEDTGTGQPPASHEILGESGLYIFHDMCLYFPW